jgi:hypothetical protein
MAVFQMRASITNDLGGVNRCWGDTATFRANDDLLAGRIVSLFATTTDAPWLLVDYLAGGYDGRNAAVYPIGITQENAAAGTPIKVCTRGFTTVIVSNGNSAPKRGSAVFGNAVTSEGRAQIDLSYGDSGARIGYVAQSEAVLNFGACVIYFDSGYF